MIELKNISIQYDKLYLKSQTIKFYPQQVHLIVGESGIGKTTLLYKIGLLSKMDYEMYVDGIPIHHYHKTQLCQFRNKKIGFVLQEKDILNHLNVYENLWYYALMVDKNLNEEDAQKILDFVCLDIELHQDVMTLSIGERQRLAIACVLVKDPDIFIFDEPTSSLDQYNENIIFDIIQKLAHIHHKYVIITSHSQYAYNIADWIYQFAHQELIVIKKGTHYDSQLHINHEKKSFSFVGNYVKKHIQKNKYKNILMIIIISLTLLCPCFISAFMNKKLNETQNTLYNQFENQIFIVSHKTNHHIDEAIYPIHLTLTQNLYPYIMATLTDQSNIFIIPYFEDTQFDDKTQGYIGLSSYKGIYISQEAKNILSKEKNFYNEKITLYLNIQEYTKAGTITHSLSYSTKINGIMKKNIQTHFIKKDSPYIYMYYKDLYSLYQKSCRSQQYAGYIYRNHNISDLKAKKEYYTNKGYYINDSFIEIDKIDKIIDKYSSISSKVLLISYTIIFILFHAIMFYIYNQRKNEITILKLNGINHKHLLYIFAIEYFQEILSATIISYIILNIFSVLNNIFYLTILIIFIILMDILIILYFLIKYLNIEKSLRNTN